ATVSRSISGHNKTYGAGDQLREIIIHTGQHYDENMSRIFFDELQIPRPDYNLGIGSDTHGRQTGRMLAGIEEILNEEKPDVVLTYGDTNSTLAGALAASKMHILSAHVEAGLRSFNRRMPEEINRVVTDHISNILFCPTETAVRNLKAEGIQPSPSSELSTMSYDLSAKSSAPPATRFESSSTGSSSSATRNPQPATSHLIGDVMYDSILFNRNLASEKSDILKRFGLLKDQRDHAVAPALNVMEYCLATIHRPENTDMPENLKSILGAMHKIGMNGTKVILPVHPRTRKYIRESGLAEYFGLIADANEVDRSRRSDGLDVNSILFLDPVGYLDMIQLQRYAKAVLTDSGGMQKEAFLLDVPCITLRNETEWVETVDAGWNILTGPDADKIEKACSTALGWDNNGVPFKQERQHSTDDNPYGDGHAAEKIIEKILSTL
ncbi:MAG: UDP-N-acetyl glucosamine 2-epimerase, partial [Deltaproteobacteria bacterium]|nr:UDP-N-acetyl glucosamine 2-epimerase [Deltaproteobacteria bacterium]